MQKKVDKIANILLKKTVKEKLPTVVFFSITEEADLIKKIFSLNTKKEYNEQKFTTEDWTTLADLVLGLANIPLIFKHIHSVENTIDQINNFSSEIENKNGLIIIECGEYDFPNISTKENIIIKKI